MNDLNSPTERFRNENERFINHLGGEKHENDEHNVVPSGCMMYVYFRSFYTEIISNS